MSNKPYILGLLAALVAGPAAAQQSASAEEIEKMRSSGREDASLPSTKGWIGRGLVGGMLAGPLGLGFVVSRANASVAADADAAVAARSLSAVERAVYREAFAARLRTRRQQSAFLGGIIGTGILVVAVIQLVDVLGDETTEFPTDQFPRVSIPLVRW